MHKYLPLLFAPLLLSACSSTMDKIDAINGGPKMAAIQNPNTAAGYQPVSMPMPEQQVEMRQMNSLWSKGRKSFFKDQRATEIGDILTVLVTINDKAKLKNKTETKRDSTSNMDVPGLAGFQNTIIGKVLPDAATPTDLWDTGSSNDSKGDSKIERNEDIELKVAATVTQILQNGNMVIQGTQQVKVNTERRDLIISGIIRPEDINPQNEISYEEIAEARVTYGGQGILTDAQAPRYGAQLADILLPF